MASIVLIAAFVGVYTGIFLASVYMVSTAERVRYPVAVAVERPAQKRQITSRPVPAIAVALTPRTLVPHV